MPLAPVGLVGVDWEYGLKAGGPGDISFIAWLLLQDWCETAYALIWLLKLRGRDFRAQTLQLQVLSLSREFLVPRNFELGESHEGAIASETYSVLPLGPVFIYQAQEGHLRLAI